MTESSWPFEDQDSTEAQFSYLFREAFDTGVIGDGLGVYADSSGMFVKCPPGQAIVRGFYYSNDSLLTLAVSPAGSSARVDSVVLQLSPSANRVRLVVKTGSSTAPALTQTDADVYEVRLADFNVPASATTIAANAVSDKRPRTSAPFGLWTTDTRPANPRRGKSGFNATLNEPEFWDGSNWTTFNRATTSAGVLSSGTIPNARLDYGVMVADRNDGRSFDAPRNGNGVNGDWNQVLQPGMYRVFAGNSNINAPSGFYPYGTLVVFGAGPSIASRTQVYFSHGDNRQYVRTAWNGNDFSAWRRFANDDELASRDQRMDGLDGSKATYDYVNGVRDNLQNQVNGRTINQGNSARMAAGNALVSNFTTGSNGYIGYVDVGWGAFNSLVSFVATAQSADSGGVVAQVSNQTNQSARIYVQRRNNAATGVNWVAVGN